MIKNLTIVLLLLFGSIITQAQTNWINYKVDNKISVKFPSKPIQISEETLLSANKDSTAMVSVSILDLAQTAQIDSAQLAKVKEDPAFVANLKDFMNSKSPYVKLEDFKIGKWNGYTNYTSMGVATDPRNKYHYVLMIIIGTKLYLFNAILSATANAEIKDDYFSSITLN
jgi:hypothetical protein